MQVIFCFYCDISQSGCAISDADISMYIWHNYGFDVKAPASMKSVVLAGWLLTTACGNLIDVVVTATRVISQVILLLLIPILWSLLVRARFLQDALPVSTPNQQCQSCVGIIVVHIPFWRTTSSNFQGLGMYRISSSGWPDIRPFFAIRFWFRPNCWHIPDISGSHFSLSAGFFAGNMMQEKL